MKISRKNATNPVNTGIMAATNNNATAASTY
jgi:hypothetical protein